MDSLGSAAYVLSVSDVAFLQGMRAAERAAQQTATAIGSIEGISVGSLDKAGASAGKSAIKFGAMFAVIGLGARRIFAMFRQWIGHTSELAAAHEVLDRQINQTYGTGTKQANEQMEKLGNKLGFTTDEMRKNAIESQQVFSVMGVGGQTANDLGLSLATLAANLARINGEDPSQTLDNIQSAMKGSSEAAIKYGVSINDLAVHQRLLKMGIQEGMEGATEAQKAIVRYQMILEQTTGVEDKAASAATSYGGAMGALKANFAEFSTLIGNILAPAIQTLASYVGAPEYLLSVERWPFHTEPPDHYVLLSHLLDV